MTLNIRVESQELLDLSGESSGSPSGQAVRFIYHGGRYTSRFPRGVRALGDGTAWGGVHSGSSFLPEGTGDIKNNAGLVLGSP